MRQLPLKPLLATSGLQSLTYAVALLALGLTGMSG